MKKILATTALLLSFAHNADARDRFPNLRPSKPSIEVNLGVLQTLQSGGIGSFGGSVRPTPVYKAPVEPYRGTANTPTIAPKKPVPAPKQPAKPAPIPAPVEVPKPEQKTPEIIAPKSLKPLQPLEEKPAPTLTKAMPEAQKAPELPELNNIPALPKPPAQPAPELPLEMPKLPEVPELPAVTAPEEKAPTPKVMAPKLDVPAIPKPSPEPKLAPSTPELPLEMPKMPEVPEMPELKQLSKPVTVAPEVTEAPKPDLKTSINTTKPVESTEIKDLSAPKAPEELPKLDAPKLPDLDLPELPKVDAPKAVAPTAKAEEARAPANNPAPALKKIEPENKTASLPPLFPSDADLPAAPTTQAPSATALSDLPPVDSLFESNDDKIAMPKLPDSSDIDAKKLPNDGQDIPAPSLETVQIKPKEAPKPSFDTSGAKPAASFPFNETETEFPLSAQSDLIEIVEGLKFDNSLVATINSYASGTEEQASQAKRTSLARALSVRRFLLEHNVSTDQIVIRPYGNKSGNGIPDRVDVVVSKKTEG